MASECSVLRTQEAASVSGNTRLSCTIYGCRRVYSDKVALENHIKEHQIPAQSVPGKVLLCSTVGCSSSFPDMQTLMLHMRHHHKPNIYYLCESCRTKLRSYRGLLTHLHSCSKVSRSKIKPAEALALQHASSSATPVMDSTPAHTLPSTGAPGPQPESAAPPLIASLPNITSDVQSQVCAEMTPHHGDLGPPNLSPISLSAVPLLALDGPVGLHEIPMLVQSPESSLPVAMPLTPSSSAAIWEKNQGQT